MCPFVELAELSDWDGRFCGSIFGTVGFEWEHPLRIRIADRIEKKNQVRMAHLNKVYKHLPRVSGLGSVQKEIVAFFDLSNRSRPLDFIPYAR
jgi:hypothetical protein